MSKGETGMAMNQVSVKVAEEQIIRFGQLLYKKGLVSGMDGNLSMRLHDNTVVITASGVHKGFLDSNQILVVTEKGDTVLGNKKPSSETPMHLAIYAAIKKANAIIHAHAPWSTAVSLQQEGLDLNVLAEGRLFFSSVEIVPFFLPGTDELANAAAQAAKKSKIFILKGHGVVAWGSNFMEAFCLIEQLENNIKIIGYSKLFS